MSRQSWVCLPTKEALLASAKPVACKASRTAALDSGSAALLADRENAASASDSESGSRETLKTCSVAPLVVSSPMGSGTSSVALLAASGVAARAGSGTSSPRSRSSACSRATAPPATSSTTSRCAAATRAREGRGGKGAARALGRESSSSYGRWRAARWCRCCLRRRPACCHGSGPE